MTFSFHPDPSNHSAGSDLVRSLSVVFRFYSGVLAILVFLTVVIASNSARGQTLDRTGFSLTFSDDFTGAVDLHDWDGNNWQGGAKWYAHTPFGADFGDAGFYAANSYTESGNLVLKASQVSGVWHAALISSEFPTGAGFAQRYGYFEARMKLPAGQGTWPAFWLFGEGLNQGLVVTNRKVTAEIDIMESYGSYPGVVHQAYHQWTPSGSGWGPTGTWQETTFTVANPSAFHTYGVLVQPDYITWYIDEAQVRRMVTPNEAKEPLFIMLNYALGAGYGTSGVANPSYTYVDFVRVFSTPGAAAGADIVVEQPAGTALVTGGSESILAVLGTSASVNFTIRNQGNANLTGLTISKDGIAAGDYTVIASPQAPVAGAGGTTNFTIQFTPQASGARPAALHIASNVPTKNPYNIILNGTGLSFQQDGDGDGMSDAAEFQMSALGFDWQVTQTARVSTYFATASGAGLYSTAQIQALNVGTPLLSRDLVTGQFKLTIGVRNSTDLVHFNPFPMSPAQTVLNAQGELEFRFSTPNTAAFFRLESR